MAAKESPNLIEIDPAVRVLPADKLRTHVLVTPVPREGSTGVRFLVRKDVMAGSLLVRQLLEDVDDGGSGAASPSDPSPSEVLEIPLLGVEAKTFAAVFEYLERSPSGVRLERPLQGDLSTLVDQWTWSYVCSTLFCGRPEASTPVDGFVFKVAHAAAVLLIPGLQELCGAAIANAMRCRSEAKILAFFNVTGPFTKDQEEEVLNQNPWLRTNVDV